MPSARAARARAPPLASAARAACTLAALAPPRWRPSSRATGSRATPTRRRSSARPRRHPHNAALLAAGASVAGRDNARGVVEPLEDCVRRERLCHGRRPRRVGRVRARVRLRRGRVRRARRARARRTAGDRRRAARARTVIARGGASPRPRALRRRRRRRCAPGGASLEPRAFWFQIRAARVELRAVLKRRARGDASGARRAAAAVPRVRRAQRKLGRDGGGGVRRAGPARNDASSARRARASGGDGRARAQGGWYDALRARARRGSRPADASAGGGAPRARPRAADARAGRSTARAPHQASASADGGDEADMFAGANCNPAPRRGRVAWRARRAGGVRTRAAPRRVSARGHAAAETRVGSCRVRRARARSRAPPRSRMTR